MRITSMATYLLLGTFTDQGIRNVRETTKRVQDFKEMATKAGATVKHVFWCHGQFDTVALLEAPSSEIASAVALSVGSLGNIQTQLRRAFTEEDMQVILGNMQE
jgi:uncharacterized protein with GYD domain